jgi:nucleotidyltransferase substrate binding protein (TIGR01987 family)
MADLSLDQLGKAIARLEEAIAANQAEPENLFVRDAVIKRFEFTFELAQSLLKKFVQAYSVNLKERDQITFPVMIRTASQDGLLREGYDTWHKFREARNRTSHAYNEDQALAVMKTVPEFLKEVKHLHTRLTEEMPA